jgi:hypothetical protein
VREGDDTGGDRFGDAGITSDSINPVEPHDPNLANRVVRPPSNEKPADGTLIVRAPIAIDDRPIAGQSRLPRQSVEKSSNALRSRRDAL